MTTNADIDLGTMTRAPAQDLGWNLVFACWLIAMASTLGALFATQSRWAPNHSPDPDLVWRQLEGLGLVLERVRHDMNAPDIARNVAQDIADAKALNVTQTPEFFVNGKPMPSFGYEQLTALVNDALATAYR